MFKAFQFLLFIGISLNLNAQKGKAELLLKDGTKIEGIGEISGISTIVSVKFRNDSLKYKTYSSDEIQGINIKENDYYRLFRYKNTDDSKYPQLMEIISNGKLSLYIKIFGHGIVSQMPLQQRAEKYLAKFDNANVFDVFGNFDLVDNEFRNNFIYVEINFPRYSYYIGQKNEDDVEHLYTRGLPFSKSYKKAMMEKFSDCLSLIKKVEEKEFKKEDVIFSIYYYNEICLD